MRVVIDTNVLIAANQRATHATSACAAACAQLLRRAHGGDVLLEDTANLVFDEYRRYLRPSGQPGPGDWFFRWYLENRWSAARVAQIDVGGDSATVSAHVPIALQSMDRSDHKWIAIYLIGKGQALYNALDSDWSEHARAFRDAAVCVVELCP